MMITGRLWKDGTWWLAESEIADVRTQGRSRKDAALMLADAFETLIDRPGCKVTVSGYGRTSGEVTITGFGTSRISLWNASISNMPESVGP
mgnify:CR=1 FL=1